MSGETSNSIEANGEIATNIENRENRETRHTVVELQDRDVNHLNVNLNDVELFSDIFGEPGPNVYSADKIWDASYHSYTSTKYWCYKILTILFAVPCAIWWALTFGCCAFCRIWCCVPCFKCLYIPCFSCGEMWELYIRIFCYPPIDALSRLCSRVKVGIAPTLKTENLP